MRLTHLCLDSKGPHPAHYRKAVYPDEFTEGSVGFACSGLTHWPSMPRENGLLETVTGLLHQRLPLPHSVVKRGKQRYEKHALPCSTFIHFHKEWQRPAPPSRPAHSYFHSTYREEKLRNKRPCFHCLNAIANCLCSKRSHLPGTENRGWVSKAGTERGQPKVPQNAIFKSKQSCAGKVSEAGKADCFFQPGGWLIWVLKCAFCLSLRVKGTTYLCGMLPSGGSTLEASFADLWQCGSQCIPAPNMGFTPRRQHEGSGEAAVRHPPPDSPTSAQGLQTVYTEIRTHSFFVVCSIRHFSSCSTAQSDLLQSFLTERLQAPPCSPG